MTENTVTAASSRKNAGRGPGFERWTDEQLEEDLGWMNRMG